MKSTKALIFAIITLAIICTQLFNVNAGFLKQWLAMLNNIVNSNYILAVTLYILFTLLACVFLALPGIIFAVMAGVLFDPWLGSLYCLIGTTLGAIMSFIAGRYFLKGFFKPIIMKNKLLSGLLFSKKNENEIILLMITRLLPIFPFNLQNFAYGITDINIVKYSIATFIFLIPGVFAFTFVSAGIISEDFSTEFIAITSAVLLLLLILLILAKRLYTKQYAKDGE